MKREIKFRGKRVDNGEWVYGYYVQDPNKGHRIYYVPFEGCSSNTYHFVIPESVGQYTGLKDKNGVDIYESDVIKFYIEPVQLEFASSEDMFGTEPQNSWQECTKATSAVRCTSEVFWNDECASFDFRNLYVKALSEEDEDYLIGDPKEIGGGADGFETILSEKYSHISDLAIDACLFNLSVHDFKNIEIIGNIF